jgi:hypothetical protein
MCEGDMKCFESHLSPPSQTIQEFRCEFLQTCALESMKRLKNISQNGLDINYLNQFNQSDHKEADSPPVILVGSVSVDHILGVPRCLFGDQMVLNSMSRDEYKLCLSAFGEREQISVKKSYVALCEYYIAELATAFRLFYFDFRFNFFLANAIKLQNIDAMWNYIEVLIRASHIKMKTAMINEVLIPEHAKMMLSQCEIEKSFKLERKVKRKKCDGGNNNIN